MLHIHTTKSNDSQTMRTMADFFRGEDLIEELARSIDLLARRGKNLGPDYHTCKRPLQIGFRRSSELVSSIT